MPKSHFKVENATALNALQSGAKIHVSGVCGVAMAQLAIELAKRGFQVSGSDKEFYEPMGGLLRKSPVCLSQGYAASNIPQDTGLVVIGNALSYENSEVLEIERRNARYSFFPKLLFDLAIEGRRSIVVSGTHGKSTTSALLSWLLSMLNLDPSYFVGAVVPGLEASLKVGAGSFSVVEGDEYDSAFFAKVPKFTFYKPDVLIITAIEFDHADIYPSLAEIEKQFTTLVEGLPEDAEVICCIDCKNVRRLIEGWRTTSVCRFTTYGTQGDADIQVVETKAEGRSQRVTLALHDGAEVFFTLPIPGVHNALNATAAYIACLLCDLDIEAVANHMAHFGGARRRQEVRFDGRVTLIDDFAHHPTAVRETIAAIRSFYPGKRLWAIFEPRSNTSRRKVFQSDYVNAFTGADRVILCDVEARSIDKGLELIEVKDLVEQIGSHGTPALCLKNADAIRDYVVSHVEAGDVVMVMSNGGFGGLVDKLETEFRSAH